MTSLGAIRESWSRLARSRSLWLLPVWMWLPLVGCGLVVALLGLGTALPPRAVLGSHARMLTIHPNPAALAGAGVLVAGASVLVLAGIYAALVRAADDGLGARDFWRGGLANFWRALACLAVTMLFVVGASLGSALVALILLAIGRALHLIALFAVLLAAALLWLWVPLGSGLALIFPAAFVLGGGVWSSARAALRLGRAHWWTVLGLSLWLFLLALVPETLGLLLLRLPLVGVAASSFISAMMTVFGALNFVIYFRAVGGDGGTDPPLA